MVTDIRLVKIDSIGNFLWEKYFGESNSEDATIIIPADNGNYYIFGTTNSSDGGATYPPYITQGGGNDWPLQLLKTTEGNLEVFGQTQSRDGDVIGLHADPPYLYPSREDVWMLKINWTNGNLLWNRCIGADRREFINNGVIQKDDRKYVMAINTVFGNRGDITCGVNEYKYFSWVSSITDTTAYVGIYDLVDISQTIKLYLNPADDYLVLENSPQFDFQNYQAEVINNEGKTVKILSLLGRNPYITIGNLPSGLYLLRLENQKMKASKRFIKK